MAKKKNIARFRTADDDKGYYDATEELNEQYREKLIAFIDENVRRIAEKYNMEIPRLDGYLKGKGKAIGKPEDFANWLFDRLPINKQGKSLPTLSDQEIIIYTEEYTRELDAFQASIATKSDSKIPDFIFKWNGSIEQLMKLRRELIEYQIISSSTTESDFASAFGLDNKPACITWLARPTKNKGQPNKKSLFDLLNVLQTAGLLEIKTSVKKRLYDYIHSIFIDETGKHLAVKTANERDNKHKETSEFRLLFEAIVKELI